MGLALDTSGCLILVEASGTLDTAALEQLTGAIDARVARGQRFLVVGDALAVDGIDAAARRFVGEHRKRLVQRATALDLGLVLALRSPVVRGAVTAISWLGGEYANLRTVEHRAELAGVAGEILGAAGMTDPALRGSLDAFAGARA